ncbi:hypothetical protein L3X38_039701 [Prunus dulcis]|uniref:Uncharacterized protein n=1 Tax=Prunus dulcis TaxID=3755 RepID=A0AAD4V8N3_PRUDU|nr:hypothetical protein L3X38_039701 [Prunus dulcis]
MAIYIVMELRNSIEETKILAAADHLFEYEEAHEENLTLSKQLQEFQARTVLFLGAHGATSPGVTHPGIAPASNSLNFGVPTNPKPVSSQKASPKFRVAQRTGPTPPSKILFSLGWADAPPHGFVPGSSRSNFPGWSPILGLLQPPTRLTSEFLQLRSQALVVGREKDLNVKVESADAIRNSIDNTDSRIGELELQLQKMKGYYSRVSCDGLIFVKRNGNDGSSVEGNSS